MWTLRSLNYIKEARMGRFPQRGCEKGSQRWIQWFVNHAPEILEKEIGLGPIEWRSPLASDEYAEYRDQAFLNRLGISPERESLNSFWPTGGPQWDALGRAKSGEAVLVEAKAHVNELYSPATGASAESSLVTIRSSLAIAARALCPEPTCDWSKQFYQYANRIAHGYFLNDLNTIPTKLVFVYFIGDTDMKGAPTSRAEWEAAIKTVQTVLGLIVPPPFVHDVFIDVHEPTRLQRTRIATGCALHDVPEKAPRDLLIEQPVAILREHRRCPDRLVACAQWWYAIDDLSIPKLTGFSASS
jgi:hypothetical protein